jgi:two-component system cell cycle sensor histidine kinase/response regulator CckA
MRLMIGLLAGTRDHVAIKDLDGRYLFVNPASAEWFGLPVASIIGRTNGDLWGATKAGAVATQDRALLIDGERMQYEEVLTEDGITRTWLTTKDAIRDVGGTIIAFGSISHEITDRVETVEALERSDGALRRTVSLLDGIINGISDHISVRDVQGRFVLVNRACADWYGTTPEAMVGQTIAEIESADEARGVLERDRVLLASGIPMNSVESSTRLGVTRTWLSTRDVIRADNGPIIAMFALSRDITELKRSETQVRQAAKMEAVGQLAGGIAHDFNNLMTIVRGYTDLVLAEPATSGDVRDDLSEVRNAADRATLLTQQLLAFSRQQVLQPKLVDINAIVAPFVPMLRRLIGETIEVEFVPGTEVPAVRVDPTQLEQVVMNLAINARDAMPLGGRLILETSQVTFDGSTVEAPAPGTFVVLAVSDTGVGMDEATRQRIFEPFFTTKEVGRGTGLGLATVYGIVSQSGGHVSVYSEGGHGSVFKVYLPGVTAASTSSPDLPESPLASPALVSALILLVEDEPAVRALMKTVLTRRGYRVIEAATPEAALWIAQNDTPAIDLLLTDVVMPGMTGPEMARRLLAWYPSLRVMYSSGYTERAVRSEDLIATGATFLAKPFTADQLRRAVGQALANDSLTDPCGRTVTRRAL